MQETCDFCTLQQIKKVAKDEWRTLYYSDGEPGVCVSLIKDSIEEVAAYFNVFPTHCTCAEERMAREARELAIEVEAAAASAAAQETAIAPLGLVSAS